MQPTWIVVADASRARVLELHAHNHLAEIEDLVNPAERNGNADLITDNSGRFYGDSGSGQGNTSQPAATAKQHEAEQFAGTVAQYLDDARNQHKYAKLQLIAAPEFLGLMRKKMDQGVMLLVENELAKDLSTASLQQVEQYVKH